MVVVVRWGGLALSLVSNLSPSCIELDLGLGFDKKKNSKDVTKAFKSTKIPQNRSVLKRQIESQGIY